MRPALLLIVFLVLWGLSGSAVLFAGMPLWAWQVAGSVLVVLALLDALRLRRRPTPPTSSPTTPKSSRILRRCLSRRVGASSP